MGIGLALASWCVKGTILATALAVLAGVLTAVYVPRGRPRRTRLILWTCAFPFACLAWFLALFVFQAYVNETMLYRDPRVGPIWQAPLPNGYAVLMIDEHHDGTVFNPKTHFSNSSNSEIHPDGTDAVSGVRVIQIAGNKILGGAGPIGQYSSSATRERVDSYFVLDTEAHTRANFDSYDALARASQAFGVQPKLEPLFRVYKRYRYTWFDALVIALFLIPVLGVGLLLVRRVRLLGISAALPVEVRELHYAN
jgi:hypothetical protein